MFGVVVDEGVFEDGFAGAGLAEDEAEAALLGVDFEDVEVALLVFEEGLVVVEGEWVLAEAEVGADHGGEGLLMECWWLRRWVFRTRCLAGGRWRCG